MRWWSRQEVVSGRGNEPGPEQRIQDIIPLAFDFRIGGRELSISRFRSDISRHVASRNT